MVPYDEIIPRYLALNQTWLDIAENAGVGFVPFSASGLDNSLLYKNGYDDWMVQWTNSTPDKFQKMMQGLQQIVDPKLKMITAYSWNEFTEGRNVLEPTVEYGFSYLDAVRDVLCEKPTNGWPTDVSP